MDQQDEEVEALRAIFGSDCVREIKSDELKTVRISRKVEAEGDAVSAVFVFELPGPYPVEPVQRVSVLASWMPKEVSERLARRVQEQVQHVPGEVSLFAMIEWLYEECEKFASTLLAKAPTVPTQDEAPSVADQADGSGPEVSVDIFTGTPIRDRKSTFQAHVARVGCEEDVTALLRQLKGNNKIAAATHNILAYRYFDRNTNTWTQDFDDDGESAAGKRLLHLLQVIPAENVAIVVSRWFGGVHLGPDRFKHINNAAREAYLTWTDLQGKADENRSSRAGRAH
mmetsp:Transcript_13048/g.40196  ORF Transcript_13048/g.40196 Transcript_13048/m.40196 type:complete len:284 (-) Transcript_13048:629-1480(-)